MKCTVIILSATLTKEAKAKLLGCKPTELSNSRTYPTVTIKQGKKIKEKKFAESRQNRHYNVYHFDDWNEVCIKACQYASKGANILIIDNTVGDVVQIYDLIKTHINKKIPLGLLHSRFLSPRRSDIEIEWLENLGPSSAKRPSGSILIGSQVLEQSLDIDADIIITKIAPSDFVIQRLGRSWRHKFHKRPSWLKTPELWIVGPQINGIKDIKVLEEVYGKTSLIYNPFILWRSSRIWNKISSINIPSDVRGILERTYKPYSDKEPKWIKPIYDNMVTRNTKHKNEAFDAMSTHLATKDDDELPSMMRCLGSSTRKLSVPSAQIVICQKAVIAGGKNKSINMTLFDGTEVTVPLKITRDFYKSMRSISISINKSMLKVPITEALAYDENKPEDKSTQFLNNVVFGRAKIVLINNDGKLKLLSGEDTEYYYSNEKGAIKPNGSLIIK